MFSPQLKKKRLTALLINLFIIFPIYAADIDQDGIHILDMGRAIQNAQQADPWLMGNRHLQDSLESLSVAAGSLPDPTISIGLANLPVTSLNFNQEAMTQAQIGISQMFPAGDSRAIKRQQLEIESRQFPFERADRKAKIAVTVGQLWLDAYKAQMSIAIIEKNRTLFDQLAEVTQSSYSSTVGKSRQQDVIRAQLELIRLEDRLTLLHQRQEMFVGKLIEWVSSTYTDRYNTGPGLDHSGENSGFSLSQKMPDIELLEKTLYASSGPINPEILYEKLSNHPAMMAVGQKIRAREMAIDLARQKYKPEWGVNAAYGYRASDAMGINRADLFSVGVSLSVPLFTANRQDKEVASARSKASAVRTEKWQLLRQLTAAFETAKSELYRLNQRQKLYQTQLLPQIHDQAEASLTAYTNDEGDFAEVVRARIAEMDAEIDAMFIDVDRQKTILQLNYFFVRQDADNLATDHRNGEIQ